MAMELRATVEVVHWRTDFADAASGAACGRVSARTVRAAARMPTRLCVAMPQA
ncbi:MAG: hypothetical protein AB1505_19140 [Candidatus Latescibacterota bacterium]